MEEGMGDWVRQQLALPQFRSDASPQYYAVFEATKATIRESSWEVARARLRPHLDVVLTEVMADRFEVLAKQLHVLARIHSTI
jgi:hypothetical protein